MVATCHDSFHLISLHPLPSGCIQVCLVFRHNFAKARCWTMFYVTFPPVGRALVIPPFWRTSMVSCLRCTACCKAIEWCRWWPKKRFRILMVKMIDYKMTGFWYSSLFSKTGIRGNHQCHGLGFIRAYPECNVVVGVYQMLSKEKKMKEIWSNSASNTSAVIAGGAARSRFRASIRHAAEYNLATALQLRARSKKKSVMERNGFLKNGKVYGISKRVIYSYQWGRLNSHLLYLW